MEWCQRYKDEALSGRTTNPSKEQTKEGRTRRKIEDIHEAARLEEEIFNEVWEK